MSMILVASLVFAQPDPAAWYLSRAKDNRQSEIDFLAKQIPLTVQTMIAAKQAKQREQAAKIASEIEDMKSRLAGLRSGKVKARVLLTADTLAVGQAGELSHLEVLQVTGPRSAIVRLKDQDRFAYDRTNVVRTEGTELFVWVEVESTASMADGRLHDFGENLFEVAGRHAHRNKDGRSVSLFLLKPFTLPPQIHRPR